MGRSIILDDFEVAAGDNVSIELKVARLPSGTEIHLPVYVFRSVYEGPVVLLSGGLHGDESNGIEIVRRMIRQKVFEHLKCGTVIAMPIINIFGFLNFSREVPDGKDVNRSFPGSKNGSLASHTAYVLTHSILPLVDFGIDYHTGGSSRTNFPQIRYSAEDPRARELADIFAAPFRMPSPLIRNSLRWQAHSMGIPMPVYEGGESMRNDEQAISEGINGTLRVLKHFGMTDQAETPYASVDLTDTRWVRARKSGMFRALRFSGQKIEKGEIIGMINDPFNQYELLIKSPVNGYIIGHNNIPVVHNGDALFHIGM